MKSFLSSFVFICLLSIHFLHASKISNTRENHNISLNATGLVNSDQRYGGSFSLSYNYKKLK